MTRLSLIAMAVIAPCASGCFIFPFPHYASPQSDSLRQNVAQELGEFPEPGRSTREKVLFRFGEPDKVSPDGARFHYQWNRIVFVGVIASYFGGITVRKFETYDLMIDFDSEGTVIVRKKETLRTWREETH